MSERGRAMLHTHSPQVSGGSCAGRGPCSPFEQQVQDLLGGGEGSVGAQEDSDIGEIAVPEGGHQVFHQLLYPLSPLAPCRSHTGSARTRFHTGVGRRRGVCSVAAPWEGGGLELRHACPPEKTRSALEAEFEMGNNDKHRPDPSGSAC